MPCNRYVHFLGMISNLIDGSADLIATSLTVTFERAKFIDYLPPISPQIGALYIKNEMANEIDYFVFLDPFSTLLWIAIFVTSFALAVFLYGISTMLGINDHQGGLASFLGLFWLTFKANLGSGPVHSKATDSLFPYRVGLFSCLISGSVIWMSYRASLTSELSVVKTRAPFNDFKTLTATNFRLAML